MSKSKQKSAIRNYRARLADRGLARFEVLGRDTDKKLVRSFARKLADEGPEADQLRSVVSESIEGRPAKKGGILEALRRSPLVGADLDLTRIQEDGREIDMS